MTSKRAVEEFLAERRLAVVGVGRQGRGFGHLVWRTLLDKGYDAIPVNPNTATVDGVPCHASLRDLPQRVGGAVVITRPEITEQVVEDAAAAGVRRLWIQQGSDSPKALSLCREKGIDAISGECILMFADPGGFHKLHRWIWGAIGKLPR